MSGSQGGWEEMWSDCWWVEGFFMDRCSLINCNHYTILNILITTDLYTLSGWIIWYENYISIKLFFKSGRARSLYAMKCKYNHILILFLTTNKFILIPVLWNEGLGQAMPGQHHPHTTRPTTSSMADSSISRGASEDNKPWVAITKILYAPLSFRVSAAARKLSTSSMMSSCQITRSKRHMNTCKDRLNNQEKKGLPKCILIHADSMVACSCHWPQRLSRPLLWVTSCPSTCRTGSRQAGGFLGKAIPPSEHAWWARTEPSKAHAPGTSEGSRGFGWVMELAFC
jgi:hypothetical protein